MNYVVPYHKTPSALRKAVEAGEHIPVLILDQFGVVPQNGAICVGGGPDCHPFAMRRQCPRWYCLVVLKNGKVVKIDKDSTTT